MLENDPALDAELLDWWRAQARGQIQACISAAYARARQRAGSRPAHRKGRLRDQTVGELLAQLEADSVEALPSFAVRAERALRLDEFRACIGQRDKEEGDAEL